MGGGGKPGKIVPLLTEILGRLKAHNVVTVHFAKSTFRTMKHLDELKKLCETPNAVTQGIEELKIAGDKNHDLMMKEFKGLKVLKETSTVSGYRAFVDAAGDWTPIKAFNVAGNYVAVLGFCGGYWIWSHFQIDKKLEHKIGEVKIGVNEVGKNCSPTLLMKHWHCLICIGHFSYIILNNRNNNRLVSW